MWVCKCLWQQKSLHHRSVCKLVLEFMFEIWVISELDVSLEESSEGLKVGMGVWGWVLVWLNTDLASSLHILCPVSLQKKRNGKGVLDGCASCYNRCCKTITWEMWWGRQSNGVVKKAELLDLALLIEGLERLTWESWSSFSPGWMWAFSCKRAVLHQTMGQTPRECRPSKLSLVCRIVKGETKGKRAKMASVT